MSLERGGNAAFFIALGFCHFMLDHGLRSTSFFHKADLLFHHSFGLFHIATFCKCAALVRVDKVFAHAGGNPGLLRKLGVVSHRGHKVVLFFGCTWHIRS